MLLTIFITALCTALAGVLLNNFIASERKIKHRIRHLYKVEDSQFGRSLGQLLGPPILEGNTVKVLLNGVQIFPAMLDAIHDARISITFESYVWWDGETARKFSAAFAAKAREGVRVHVLLDGMGCNCTRGATIQDMRDAGVEVTIYHLSNLARFNYRTHRKLLVVDGRRGFTGGVGIADEWGGDAGSPKEWRDTHYDVTGPVVAQMQAAFNDNWMKARTDVLDGPLYFPAIKPTGNLRCQMFKSSPQEGSESARLMFLLSIAAAVKNVKIGNAYFVPDSLTTTTLIEALGRGVVVEILLPGEYQDSNVVRRASRERWGVLLKHGARIFEYQPTMYHCKCMIIDGHWTSVGSANFDNRSFRLNDEANLNILDPRIAMEETENFERDKAKAREVTYEEWLNRPLGQKMADKAASLFRSQF